MDRRAQLTLTSVFCSLAIAAPAAWAVDVDRDGYHDFLVREAPYLPNNVGANCDLYYSNGVWYGRLTIRPPRVWGLKKLGRQRVAWRARFYDVQNRRFVWNGSWVYDVVGPGQATDFGGGPDAPQAMVHWNQYWTGGQWYEHPQGDGQQIRAVVKAAWYNARRSRWIYRSVDVRWQFSTANRTIGEGQLGPASTPVTSWVC